jgi:Carboxypeptidase regulatory-like domain
MSYRRFPTIVTVLLVASGLSAQENRASLTGQVTDATGASVPNALVKALSQEQGVAAETLTNDSGRYQIGFLEPGTYTVTIEMAGFKKYILEQVQLVTGQKMGLDVQLELGTQAESVRVTGEAPLLSTETAMRGQNVSSKELRDVPNNGLIFLQMVWAMAGVVRTTNDWGSMGAQESRALSIQRAAGNLQCDEHSLVLHYFGGQPQRDFAYVRTAEPFIEQRIAELCAVRTIDLGSVVLSSCKWFVHGW